MGILQMSGAGAVLILVTVLVRTIGIHHLPKKTFLILWVITLGRLLLPISIPSPFSVYSLTGTIFPRSTIKIVPLSADAAQATQPAQQTFPIFLLVWGIVAGFLMLFFAVTHIRCRMRYRTALPIASPFLTAWLERHPLRRKIQIRQSDQITTPMTYGIFRPVILLPKKLDQTNVIQLHYILLHEYTHIRRFDIVGKFLLAAALCIHWFNPLVWVMYVLANRDIELANDETVIHKLGLQARADYAMALVNLEAEKAGHLPSLSSSFSQNATKERIVAIMKLKKVSVIGIIAAALVVAGTTTAFATSAANNQKSESTNLVETKSTTTMQTNEKDDTVELEDDKVHVVIDKNGAPIITYYAMESDDNEINVDINDDGTVSATDKNGKKVDVVYEESDTELVSGEVISQEEKVSDATDSNITSGCEEPQLSQEYEELQPLQEKATA